MRYFQKYLLLSAAFAFLSVHTGYAQDAKTAPGTQPAATPLTAKTDDSADKIVQNFFALMGKDQIDQACDYLTNGTKIADNLEWVAALKVKTKEAVKSTGTIQGYELLGIQNVGTHLMRSTYIALGKGYPLVWKFYFYKSDNAWKLIDLRLEIGLSDVFEDNKAPQEPARGQ
jgi:hypothetical protein